MKDSPPEEKLADALDRVLNKGIVMDAQVRASAATSPSAHAERVVIASTETRLEHDEKVSFAAPAGGMDVQAPPVSGAGFADRADSPDADKPARRDPRTVD